MKMNNWLAPFFAIAVALLKTPAMGETIISIDTPDDGGYGCLVIFSGQGYRVGWTQTNAYSAVTVSVKMSSGGPSNQTGRAYLTTQIGPGTTTNHEIASTAITYPAELTNLVVFQDLYLPAGSYYLSIIGDVASWGCWKGGVATNIVTGTDVSALGGFGMAGGPDDYFPATPAYQDPSLPPEFKVEGINASPPLLQITQSDNLVQLSWSTNAVGFVLESADILPSTNWQGISQPLATNSGSFVFTTNANGIQFFRLSKPTH